jgi:hypothetical protein
VALGALVLLLLVSGSVRGEAGRIAVPLMPALLVAAGALAVRPATAAFAGALLAASTLALRLCWDLP